MAKSSRVINIGDSVLCYSCERCRIEKRPRDKEYFFGIVTAIDEDIATVRNKRGYNMYYHVCCLENVNGKANNNHLKY